MQSDVSVMTFSHACIQSRPFLFILPIFPLIHSTVFAKRCSHSPYDLNTGFREKESVMREKGGFIASGERGVISKDGIKTADHRNEWIRYPAGLGCDRLPIVGEGIREIISPGGRCRIRRGK